MRACVRIPGVLVAALIASMDPASSLASTNVVTGMFYTHVSGEDIYGYNVVDMGGGIQYLKLKTFRYPDYYANPMHQDIQGFAYAYNPAITSTEDHVDEDGNSYRFSWWGSSDDPYPGTIEERIYSLTNTFTAILIDTLDGMPSTTEFPIPSGTIPPEVTRRKMSTTLRHLFLEFSVQVPTRFSAGRWIDPHGSRQGGWLRLSSHEPFGVPGTRTL